MTAQEIADKFNTPSQQEADRLRHINVMLENIIHKNNQKINSLTSKAAKEQDYIADQLDKSFPQWRQVIIDAVSHKNKL